jgi:hypothetical protein
MQWKVNAGYNSIPVDMNKNGFLVSKSNIWVFDLTLTIWFDLNRNLPREKQKSQSSSHRTLLLSWLKSRD